MRLASCSYLLLLGSLLVHSLQARSFLPKSSSVISVSKSTKKNHVLENNYKQTQTVSKVSPGGSVESKSSMSKSIFNLVKGIVGVGVLSLPNGVAAFGDAKGAIIPAVALITGVGILSAYNFALIGRVCSIVDADSYSDAWRKSIGPSTAWIPALACTCKTFLAVLAYSMVLAETFQGIFKAAGLNASRTQSLLGLTSVVLFPLCLMKNLSSLAPFSLLGIIGMLLTVCCMGIRYFDGSYLAPAGKFLGDIGTQPSFGIKGAGSVFSPNAFILICMLSTAYMAHFNAPKFYQDLEEGTIEKFNKLVSISFAVSIIVFSTATAIGFATFGKSASGFVLSDYSSKDSLIGLSRVAVAFSLIFTYPLVFVGCRDGFLDLISLSKEKRTNAILNKITFFLLSCITIAAYILKDLSFVLSFGGATLGNALIYVFPALMFLKCVKDLGAEASNATVLFTKFSASLGVSVGVIGANMALKKL